MAVSVKGGVVAGNLRRQYDGEEIQIFSDYVPDTSNTNSQERREIPSPGLGTD